MVLKSDKPRVDVRYQHFLRLSSLQVQVVLQSLFQRLSPLITYIPPRCLKYLLI